MRRKIFRSIDDVLAAGLVRPWQASPSSDRVLRSTRLEDRIYTDLRQGDESLDAIEGAAKEKLESFGALSRDVYQSFYSLGIRKVDENDLSDTARHFNRPILDDMMSGDDYPTIKSVCEGRQLPAYEAASEFVESISSNLDGLLDKISGDKGALHTLEKAKAHEERLHHELENLMDKRHEQGANSVLDRQIVDRANKAVGKAQQIKAIAGQIENNLQKNKDALSHAVAQAAQAAMEKAEETALTMAAWGQGDATPEKMALARETIAKTRSSHTLREISRLLGRYKEILARARKNSYAYGRGEKYTIELGNSLSRVLTAEFAALATPETIPLFLRKHQGRRLQQYKKREAIYKGIGDIIICLDESASARDDAPWGKALALTLLDAAMSGNRKLALIHFSHTGSFKTDVFIPGKYDTSDVLTAAETFLGGGTDFETPLKEALRLMEQSDFRNADIVFVTDGECQLSADYTEVLQKAQRDHGFKVTGILLDMSSPGMGFSLEGFCQEVFRTSERTQDCIVESIISTRV